MKKAVLTLFLAYLWAISASGDEVARVLKKFDTLEALHLPAAVEYRVYDPFKRAAPLVKKSSREHLAPAPAPIRVTAVMNDRAFVNGRWVHAGEYIGRYKIARIGSTGVVLKSGNITRFVPLGKRKRILKIKENL